MIQNANLKGALLMTGSMGAFTLNDVFVKLLAEDLPLFQIVFLRGLLTTGCLSRSPRISGSCASTCNRATVRGSAGARPSRSARWSPSLMALVNMPIANATAILAALPLSVTVAAALFLGEPLGWRRMSAVTIGFIGVLLIVRPGTEGSTCGRSLRFWRSSSSRAGTL
jgi:S-adenosylmethionine uptake transporter